MRTGMSDAFMDTPATSFLEHGLVVVGLLVLVTLIGLIYQIRRHTRLIDTQTQQMADLQGAVAAYGQTLIAARTLLDRMETRISEYTNRNLEIQSQFAFNRSFEEAARLVRDGGTVESLVADCGLSDAEAALMVRLHQRDQEKPRQQWRSIAPEPAGQTEPDNTMTSEEIRLQESIRAAQSSR